MSVNGATLPTRASSLLPRVLAWVALILFETAAQAALKAGGEALAGLPLGRAFVAAALVEPWVWVGALGYIGSFVAWMVILDRMPLSRGFPMSSLVAVAVVAASVFLFGEVLDGWRIAGLTLILSGLALMRNDEG
ncbi:EamA family transporter [Aureimonas sp. D3]|uniref:EamA family transporter n=1 Tax=Aureimonas sp. D3 TaxID=1638164 RepID=UPI000B0ED25D|nr:EamA family transporter [Aureimonas sp. D3]